MRAGPNRDVMGRYSERSPDTYPRWALIVEPYNRIKPVLLAVVDVELKKGMGRYVLAREDAEMFAPESIEPAQRNPMRHEDEEC